jgi:molybdate transport system permease protein
VNRAVSRPLVGLLLPAALGLLLIVLPLIGLLSQISWTDVGAALRSDDVLTSLRLSLECSLLALALAAICGVPLGYLLARTRMRFTRLLRGAVLMPLVLPPVASGIALQAAFGRATPLGRVLASAGITLPFSTLGAALAETFVAMPLLVLAVEAGLRQRSDALEEAAATLGAGPWRRFWLVTLPLLAPSLAAGAALTWARALGEFGATITFAGSLPGTTETLPLAAYTAFAGSGATGRAVTLSLLLLLIAAAVLLGVRGGRGLLPR